jgi:hypothetical protein
MVIPDAAMLPERLEGLRGRSEEDKGGRGRQVRAKMDSLCRARHRMFSTAQYAFIQLLA